MERGRDDRHSGPRIYEPQIDQTQLSQAVKEFKFDYTGQKREQSRWQGTVTDVVLRDAIYLLNEDDESRDHAALKTTGDLRSKQLFRDAQVTPSADPDMARLVGVVR
nr:hypothetical protein [Pseudomonas sp.]